MPTWYCPKGAAAVPAAFWQVQATILAQVQQLVPLMLAAPLATRLAQQGLWLLQVSDMTGSHRNTGHVMPIWLKLFQLMISSIAYDVHVLPAPAR